MAETVKLPGVGKVKTTYAYAAGALVVGIVGYAWWTKGMAGAPAEEEFLTEADIDAMGDERIPPTTVDTYDVAIDTRTGIKTNAEWHQAATYYLAGLGYESTVVSTALGRFIARKALNKVDTELVRQAVSSQGMPPEGGPWTIIEEQTPAAVGLAAPTGAAAVVNPNGSARITWQPVSGASGYEVRRYGGGSTKTTDTFHQTGVFKPTDGRNQAYFIRAYNSAGQFSEDAKVTFTLPVTTAAKPAGLQAQVHPDRSVSISWQPVAGATLYEVRRYGGSKFTQTATTHRTKSFSRREGRNQAYFVRARVGSSWGPYSQVNFTLPA